MWARNTGARANKYTCYQGGCNTFVNRCPGSCNASSANNDQYRDNGATNLFAGTCGIAFSDSGTTYIDRSANCTTDSDSDCYSDASDLYTRAKHTDQSTTT